MLKVFLYQALVIFIYAVSWFVVALVWRRNDVADIAWGGGFVVAAATAFLVMGVGEPRAILVLVLVTTWGLRLMIHIALRNRVKAEDRRYKAWREEWGKSFVLRTFLQVFLLQGLLILIIVLPVTKALTESSPPLNVLDAAGIVLWLAGFFFEAIGDFQLLRFKSDSANIGKIMTTGLWRYTRHPNYFGEVTLWWGLFLVCLSVPGSFWTIIGPLTITYLILKVSGTPLLEKRFAGNPEYDQYIKNTSGFFPLPPQKKGGQHVA